MKIDQSGAFYWNDTPVDEQQLKTQIAVIATKSDADQPEVQIDAADQVPYQTVARVLADAKSYGLNKIGFTDSNGQ